MALEILCSHCNATLGDAFTISFKASYVQRTSQSFSACAPDSIRTKGVRCDWFAGTPGHQWRPSSRRLEIPCPRQSDEALPPRGHGQLMEKSIGALRGHMQLCGSVWHDSSELQARGQIHLCSIRINMMNNLNRATSEEASPKRTMQEFFQQSQTTRAWTISLGMSMILGEMLEADRMRSLSRVFDRRGDRRPS